MTQGNQFGPAGGRWMQASKLRALFTAGLTYDEIAEINERSEGWKPSRSAVLRKYRDMGMPPRRATHHDLIPWRVSAEHSNALVRHMLEAESRSRQHRALSETDRKLVRRLHEILFGRGTLMVVDYHPEVGFSFVMREDGDEDIIRQPHSAKEVRKDLAAALRNATNEELAHMARREGLRPELLENAGRDVAADMLRKMIVVVVPPGPDADALAPDADVKADAVVPVVASANGRRRRASGA